MNFPPLVLRVSATDALHLHVSAQGRLRALHRRNTFGDKERRGRALCRHDPDMDVSIAFTPRVGHVSGDGDMRVRTAAIRERGGVNRPVSARRDQTGRCENE